MAKAHKGKLRSIHIRPAKNGYMVEAQHDRNPSSPSDMPTPYREPQPSVHTSRQSALDHVGKLMAAHEGEPDADDQAPMPVKRGRQALGNVIRG